MAVNPNFDHDAYAKKYLIKAHFTDTLGALLGATKVANLQELAANYDVKNRSKLKKAELVAELEQIIANPEEMKRVMNYATEQEFQLMLRIAADEDLSNCTIEHDLYQYFAKNGYFYLVEEKKQVAYAMPLIIKEILHKINTAKYRKERDEFQKIWRYCIACSNLYGAITPEKVSELYKEHYSEIVTAKQIVEVMNTFACRSDAAAIKNGHIVNGFMFEHGNVDALLKEQREKTYYMPEKEELLRYEDPHFYEMTPQLEKLADYVRKTYTKNEEKIKEFLDDTMFAVQLNGSFQDHIHIFEGFGFAIKTQKQLRQISELLMKVTNYTRMWVNRGYTPLEYTAQLEAEAHLEHPTLKVGRNDPCPCGSGKKYKKCCGA